MVCFCGFTLFYAFFILVHLFVGPLEGSGKSIRFLFLHFVIADTYGKNIGFILIQALLADFCAYPGEQFVQILFVCGMNDQDEFISAIAS